MSIELPKDAEGREIPLDTEVLYDRCGTKVSVKEFLSRTSVENQRTGWTIKAADEGNIDYNSFKPKNMHLTQPDTWEKLEEDLDRCISGDSACRYFAASENCEDCRIDKNNEQGGCVELVFKDIKDRIRKLRGELIDRPTCHLIEDEDGRTACSECGCIALYLPDATYCPDCGSIIERRR